LNGTCRAGSRCRFAHGQHELQDPPEDEEFEEYLHEMQTCSRKTTVDYRDARDSHGNPLLPSFFGAGLPMSPSLSPMSFPLNNLPFGVPNMATPEQQRSSPQAAQPEIAMMAKCLQMISDIESSDSKAVSPKEQPAPPPPVPTKWQKAPSVGDTSPQNLPQNAPQNVPNFPKKHLKGTPERKGRPNRPLSPLSPTTLNCLPSALFSPGSLSPAAALLD
jgi:hypothetical protein